MNMQGRHNAGWLALALLLLSPAGFATTVFRTVNDQGVVSFSDTPPQAGTPVETIELSVPAPVDDGEGLQRLEAMRETTDRMAEARREREKHRAELRKQRIEESRQAVYYPDDSYGNVGYYSSYRRHRRSGIGGGWWPVRPPQPEHPIVRPPLLCPPEHGKGPHSHHPNGKARRSTGRAGPPMRANWRPSINQRPGFSMNRSINQSFRNR